MNTDGKDKRAIMQQQISGWNIFFAKFSGMLQRWEQPPSLPLSPQVCADFFLDFAGRYNAYRKQGRSVDYIRLAGIGRDELQNSAFLAWLLDASGDHGQGADFLRCFLSCLWENGCPTEKNGRFPSSSDISGAYRTFIENSYEEEDPEQSGKQRSRIDIELDGPGFLLLIEVKIHAGETDTQLARYLGNGGKRAGNRPWGLVFVTTDGHPPADDALHGKIACVNWRSLGRAFLRHVAAMPADSHGTVIIRQFCEHITRL
jgi:hypothetical protein